MLKWSRIKCMEQHLGVSHIPKDLTFPAGLYYTPYSIGYTVVWCTNLLYILLSCLLMIILYLFSTCSLIHTATVKQLSWKPLNNSN